MKKNAIKYKAVLSKINKYLIDILVVFTGVFLAFLWSE